MTYDLLRKCKHKTHVNMSIVNACSLVCYFFEFVPEHSPLLLLSELMIQAQTWVLSSPGRVQTCHNSYFLHFLHGRLPNPLSIHRTMFGCLIQLACVASVSVGLGSNESAGAKLGQELQTNCHSKITFVTRP